jgi:ADP-ribosylglycohydrolase
MADLDRVVGVLLGPACGDALGAGYEFGPPLPDGETVVMKGGNGFKPGEWTDDTAMMVPIAQAIAAGQNLRSREGLEFVAQGFLTWYASGPKDVGLQTRAVLGAAGSAAEVAAQAADFFARRPNGSAGNGALMRTAPVALAYLDDADGLTAAAFAVGALTHADPVSGEACVLWCHAIRHAALTGTFDGLRLALDRLPPDRAVFWEGRIDEAESSRPRDFDHNGWVVQALQAAWSAIITTPEPSDEPSRHLVLALEAAVRGGRDTDTVAAIAGGLLGARWGASAIPTAWRDSIFGWPGYRAEDLEQLGRAIADSVSFR